MNELCDYCKKEIPQGAPHFWGRHGGTWHPLCRATLDCSGAITTGMWINTIDAFSAPDEYKQKMFEMRGFRKEWFSAYGTKEEVAQRCRDFLKENP